MCGGLLIWSIFAAYAMLLIHDKNVGFYGTLFALFLLCVPLLLRI